MKRTPCPSALGRRCRQTTALGLLLAIATAASTEDRTRTATPQTGREAAARASERIDDYRQSASDVNKAEVKAALAELDAQIAHLESLASTAPDEAKRHAARARLDALKERRDELHGDYNQARFDQLKADVRREWNEFKGWVRNKAERDTPTRNERPDTAAVLRDTADYLHAPETGGAPVVPPERLARSGDTDKGTTERPGPRKAALARVDQELELLEDRAEKLDTTAKEQLQARIEELQERRNDLEKNFSETRYTSLVREIRTELDRARAAAE